MRTISPSLRIVNSLLTDTQYAPCGLTTDIPQTILSYSSPFLVCSMWRLSEGTVRGECRVTIAPHPPQSLSAKALHEIWVRGEGISHWVKKKRIVIIDVKIRFSHHERSHPTWDGFVIIGASLQNISWQSQTIILFFSYQILSTVHKFLNIAFIFPFYV